MSTKLTISSNDHYHLYQEAFDKSVIYLQIDDCPELDVKVNSYNGDTEKQVTIAISPDIWRHLIEGSKRWIENE